MENFFDTVAQNWDTNDIHVKRTYAIASELIKSLDKSSYKKAMEFGSGTGLLSFALHEYFSAITMMDSSIEMTKVAQSKIEQSGLSHLKTIHFDMEKQRYNSETYNAIFSQMALHHVDDIEKIFSNFYSLLENDGLLAIADLFTEDGTFHDASFTGYYGFDPENLKRLLLKTGFKEVDYVQCYEIKRMDALGFEKEFPIFLLTAKK